jgi:hypothetical protein
MRSLSHLADRLPLNPTVVQIRDGRLPKSMVDSVLPVADCFVPTGTDAVSQKNGLVHANDPEED